jgi:hypothetical protein
MADSTEDDEIKYPEIKGFSADEIVLVHQLCDLHYTLEQIAKSMGLHIDHFLENTHMMNYINEIHLQSEMLFIKALKSNALGGDKNAIDIILRRIHNAKTISDE